MKAMSTVNLKKKCESSVQKKKRGTIFQDHLPYFNYL